MAVDIIIYPSKFPQGWHLKQPGRRSEPKGELPGKKTERHRCHRSFCKHTSKFRDANLVGSVREFKLWK
jgi:hypothetical protein